MAIVFASAVQDEALVVKSLLESAGIAAEVLAEGMLDATPLFTTAKTGARVAVPDEDEADAAALVADYRANKGKA